LLQLQGVQQIGIIARQIVDSNPDMTAHRVVRGPQIEMEDTNLDNGVFPVVRYR
jgi:hypothetical protein